MAKGFCLINQRGWRFDLLLRIDRSLFEKKDGVLPYEVAGRKDGKPFDFSVGPRGRFLGMDD